MTKQLIGGYELTGIYLSRDDFAELKQVIKKAHVKDATMKRIGGVQVGAQGQNGRLVQPPTLGSMGIQDFVRKLVKNYGFKDSDKVLYGVNNKGEILRWLSPDQVTDISMKHPGRKQV